MFVLYNILRKKMTIDWNDAQAFLWWREHVDVLMQPICKWGQVQGRGIFHGIDTTEWLLGI